MYLLLLLWLSSSVYAQTESGIDVCRTAVQKHISTEHRVFRSVLFGEPEPELAPVSHVTFSKAGDSWIKTDTNAWRSLAEGFKSTTWTNTLMNNQTAITPRRGIFETKRVTTSDLIPAIVNATATFECRLSTFCRAVEQSMLTPDSEESASFTVTIPGCEEHEVDRVLACSPKADVLEQSRSFDIFSYCMEVVRSTMEREQDLLKTTVEYDAAYRNTLQFAGSFDQFIGSLQFPMENTIRQVINVLGSLQRIPCFVSSCDDYPLLPTTTSSTSSSASSNSSTVSSRASSAGSGLSASAASTP